MKILKIIAVILVLLPILNGCDSRNVETGNYKLVLTANPETIFRDNGLTSSQISAILKDSNDYPLGGEQILFKANIGSILGAITTDSSGVAKSTFWDSNQLGLATIDANYNGVTAQVEVMIIEPVNNEVQSIVFNAAPLDIQVQGTGGQESAVLSVYLQDLNGNLVDGEKRVDFVLLNSPLGTVINGLGISDSTMSQNGVASVIISSGVASGIVRVRATTYQTNGMPVSAEKANIIIHSGAPNSVDFSISGDNGGEDMGGGLWAVEVSALLTDSYGNPVDTGTAVFFSLPEDPDYASIRANSYVGNENANGDTLEGTAYTLLSYEGVMTNEWLQVQVDTGDFNDSDSLRLPIQMPSIDITVTPAHLDWDESSPNNPPDDQVATVRVIIKDGQNNPINNQRVIFNSSLGEPVDMGTDDDNDDYSELSGQQGEAGLILKEMMFHRYECPAPGPAGPGMTTSTVTATILGNMISGTETLTLFRYEDFNP
ncbi:MAG: Ig-like domain-containing protein [Candidatus Cloacimonetes bacterium]|nr:Ig-like domain-containing protein [Candidatus Cloacimonadota bacterium]